MTAERTRQIGKAKGGRDNQQVKYLREDKKRRKGLANLFCPRGAQLMTHSLWSDKGRNQIREGMRDNKRRNQIRLIFIGRRGRMMRVFCLV